MGSIDLSCGFREQLEDAVALWKRGEDEAMMCLINSVWADAFDEGCVYMKEQVVEFLNKNGGNYNGR